MRCFKGRPKNANASQPAPQTDEAYEASLPSGSQGRYVEGSLSRGLGQSSYIGARSCVPRHLVNGRMAVFEEFQWLNEPAVWRAEDGRLALTTGDRTDFWQHTFYDFSRDSGHAFLQQVSGDFSASAVVTGRYEHLYDQAGMMLRVDETHWIKAGIEYTDGLMHFSVVVTRGVSDWSVIPLQDAGPQDDVHVRLTRHGDAVRVQYAIGGKPWQMARLAPFADADASVGVMACSPERSGFQASFRDVWIGPAISRQLHDT
jgi:regulation of enolase protein 1 (concanavalin A-like superfamily)